MSKKSMLVLVCLSSVLFLFITPEVQSLSLIVWGDRISSEREFPFVVQIYHPEGRCTGTLIAPKWILTAAHCTFASLVFGFRDLSRPYERFTVSFGYDSRFQIVQRNAIVHPDYRGAVVGLSNDIALLELNAPATYAVPVEILTDALRAANPIVGTNAVIVGYGLTEYGRYPGGPIKAELPIIQCSPRQLSQNEFCLRVSDAVRTLGPAGAGPGNPAPAEGDSGGPVLVRIGDSYKQVAIMKGTNTNIDLGNYRDWIMQYVPPVPVVGTESFSITDRGGQSTTTSGTAETLRVGYGRIRAGAGSTTPSGVAIFQFRDSEGVLISEAGVPATEAIREGRIFAEVNGPVNTGLAIANPNGAPATIRFYFTDTSGTRSADGSFELGAHQQTAKFLDQAPFNGGPSVWGTFTFESSMPVAVVALRGLTNEAGEFLMTTLPVAHLVGAPSPFSRTPTDTVYFPHFADGGGWTTQVILVNPTDGTIAGTVGFLEPGSGGVAASPVVLVLDDGTTGSSFDYSIPPRSVQKFTTSNPTGRLAVGSVRATPSSGNAAPSGLVVFSYVQDGKTVSEAGVPALPKGSAFRVYVEASGTPDQAGSIRSGLAITNTASTSNTVTLEVTRLDGSLAVAPSSLSLPPSGQMARFLDQVFSLPDNFSGVLRVTSTTEVAMVALRLRVNERGELKMTTTSPSNEMDPSTSQDRFFAHLADSVGWSTQFILFSGTAGQNSSGTLSLTDASGEPLERSP